MVLKISRKAWDPPFPHGPSSILIEFKVCPPDFRISQSLMFSGNIPNLNCATADLSDSVKLSLCSECLKAQILIAPFTPLSNHLHSIDSRYIQYTCLVLCCLMTPDLRGHSVSCMTILFLNLQITRSDIRPHIKWAVSLVLAYGHFNIPLGFMWVCMG